MQPDERSAFEQALAFQQTLQHIERIALETAFDPDALGAELKQVMVRSVEVSDFTELEDRLREHQSLTARICQRLIAAPETEGTNTDT